MSEKAYLPCLVCGNFLRNVFVDADNQPSEGTVFRTQGHYGSTFWDSFDGEDLVITVCDRCLRERSDRLGQQKVAQPVRCEGFVGFGEQEVDRPLVAYTGNPDKSELVVDVEDLGTPIPGVRWVSDIADRKADLMGKGAV